MQICKHSKVKPKKEVNITKPAPEGMQNNLQALGRKQVNLDARAFPGRKTK